MGEKNLVEKLSLQVEFFREGFEILSNSFSFEEMVKNLLHLIRGNFLTTNISAYHKNGSNSSWNIISPNGKADPSASSYFNENKKISVQYFENKKYDVSITLPTSDNSSLGILIGPKLDKTKFSDLDKITLQILLQVFDSAHKSFLNQKKEKELNFELNEKVVQLNSLIDTVIEASRFDKRGVLFELVLERIASLTNASSALLQITSESQVRQYPFPPNINADEIMASCFKIESSFEFGDASYQFILSEKETRRGLVNFNDLDKHLLDAMTRQVEASIQNEYLNAQAIEKEKMEQEIIVAASIQQRILPEELPKIEGCEIFGINIPSKEVGGDYYNCIDLNNGKYALIIADVTGKGIAAALLVSTLDAALYSYLQFDIPVSEITDRLNKLIFKSSPSDKFITFFIVVYDSKSGELDFVNAGHNSILLLRKNGTLEKLESGGVALGMFDLGIPYPGEKLVMNPGDKLFFYTDGIPEAMNETGEEYSDEKMIKFFMENSDSSSKEFVEAMVKDVKLFAGSTQQSDDITALYLKRN